MAQKRPVAPDTPIKSFPTPILTDLVVTVDVDSRLPGYKPLEYGTPYPDQTRFAGAKLVSQAPLEDDRFVRRVYATDRVNQDAYNKAITYSGGSLAHPIYVRSYIVPREGYAPLPDGSVDPEDAGALLLNEESKPADGELNSLYLQVSRLFETLPGPVITSYDTNEAGQVITVTSQRKSTTGYSTPTTSALRSFTIQSEDVGVLTEQIRTLPSIFSRKTFSAERPDMLPQKFRAAIPDVETSEIVEGQALQPTLATEDISASQTQQTLYLKQVSSRSRPAPEYPLTIVEKSRTRLGQTATTTSTLDLGQQQADLGPLVESSEVTDLGDGRSIKVTTVVDGVFGESSYTKSKEDLTPAKFRANVNETLTEQTVSGTAAMPTTLGVSEFLKSEQQITVDKKRTQVRERYTATSNSLSESVVTNEGQLGTRTITLSAGTQTITTSATLVSGEIEELGDGRTVKTIVTVPTVFAQKSFTKSKEDVTPVKFRALLQDLVTEETAAGTATQPVLDTDDLSKTVQAVTVDKIRTQTRTRATPVSSSLTGEIWTSELGGGTATVTENYGTGAVINPTFGTVAAELEALGDGKSVSKQIQLTPATLSGQIYDDQLNLVLPYTQSYVAPGTGLGTTGIDSTPKDVLHTLNRTLEIETFKQGILGKHWITGQYVTVNLPDVLTELEIEWTKASSTGGANTEGDTYSVTASGSITVTGDLRYTIKAGYQGPVGATRHIFFLPSENAGIDAIKGQTGADDWPAVFPQTVTVTMTGGQVSIHKTKSYYPAPPDSTDTPNTSDSTSYNTSLSTNIVTLPATLHGNLTINPTTTTIGPFSYTGNQLTADAPTLDGTYKVKGNNKTGSHAVFPAGDYLVSVETESYKYDLVRVSAVVAHITSAYVTT